MSRVFVLGNAGVDLSLSIPHLARPGETVVAAAATRAPGGKGLNQAVVAARAGGAVTFCAPVGDDEDAAFVAATLARETLDTRLLAKPCATDRSIVMVADDGENSIVSLCACADALTEDEANAFAADIAPGDWLLLQGNLTEAVTRAAMRAARGRVMLNPAPLRWPILRLLPDCDVVVVNRVEAEQTTRLADPEAAARWLHARGAATAIVTLGAHGCIWASGGDIASRPAIPAQAVDTSGAGDAFCGVLVAQLADGVSMSRATAEAQAAAATCVTRRGAFAGLPEAIP